MSEQIVLRCEDSLEGIFTALFDAFVCKNKMKAPYTDSISIAAGEGEMTLFAREIEVQTDAQKVQKTVYSIQSRLGYPVYDTLLHALCHFAENRGTAVLGYLVRAFAQGRGISDQLADPFALRVMELSRKVDNELDKLLGFVRFQDLGSILVAQLDMTSVNNQQNDHERETACNARYNLYRAQPKLIHIGIDDIHGDKPHQDPSLDACAFVHQIVSCAAQRYLTVSAGTFFKIIGKVLYMRLGKVGILTQYRKQVIDGFLALCDIFNHDLPVRIDDIGAGSSAEGRIVHGFHHNVIVAADGNRIVGKAAVDTLCFGADKHQHRVLSGQDCIHHNVVPIGKLLVEVALQTKIARFPAGCHVVAVVRKKVEFGKAELLLCGFQIRLNPVIIGVTVQKAVPQMQIGDVFVGDLAQPAVGFMHTPSGKY